MRDEPAASVIAEMMEGFASGRFQTKRECKYFLEGHPQFPKGAIGKIGNNQVDNILNNPLYAEKLAACAHPVKPYEQMYRTAVQFLVNPHKIWACSGSIEKRTVLKLAFCEPLIWGKKPGIELRIYPYRSKR